MTSEWEFETYSDSQMQKRSTHEDYLMRILIVVTLTIAFAVIHPVISSAQEVAQELQPDRQGVVGIPLVILGRDVPEDLVGATEKIFEGFVGIPYIGGGTENWTPYVMALIFLLFRPQGLFGEKIIDRV